MTDDHSPQDIDASVAAEADDTGATVVGVVAADGEVQAVGGVVTDYDNAVIVAASIDRRRRASSGGVVVS